MTKPRVTVVAQIHQNNTVLVEYFYLNIKHKMSLELLVIFSRKNECITQMNLAFINFKLNSKLIVTGIIIIKHCNKQNIFHL